ncbi:MAG: hypothetical protein KIT00_00425 [Rhodospirillales bacterium]|nr:hypothetical protein [Rhodospirillales bacterium]
MTRDTSVLAPGSCSLAPGGVRLLACPRPFSSQRIDHMVPVGGTVADIIAGTGMDPVLTDNALVWLCDEAMTREPVLVVQKHWHRVRPKPGTVLTVRVVPQGGGGGGGKNPLRVVLTIAVVAAAFVLGPALGVAMGLSTNATILGVSGINLAAAVGGGLITMVGNLLINAVAPPPRPKLGELSLGGPQSRTSPTLAITGTQNRANRYGPVPRVYGRHRVFPTLAAHPYTDVEGSDQYIRMLFDFGYGPLQLSEMRIGPVPLAQYEGVDIEARQGFDTDPPVTLYSNTIREDQYSLKVTDAGGPQVLESRDNADEILIDITFQGLVSFASGGGRRNRSVDIQIEYRKAGTSDSWTDYGTFTYTAATEQIVRRGQRIVPAEASRYEIRFTRITEDNTSAQIRDDSFVTAIRTVQYTEPVKATGRCLVALRIKATDQLNGIVDQFSAVAEALLPVWDDAIWTAPQATRHPAWAYLDVLRGAANRRPVADERLDLDAFKAWADARPDDTFDAVIDYPTTVFELLRDIAASGRAAFGMRDGKFSVVRDLPQTVPVQHFTPRNATGFRGLKTFTQQPHGLKVRFINPDREWGQDERIVYADGYDETNASRFETLELFGCTDADLAWKHGRYHLAAGKLRPETYELSCDIDHLVCTAGDLVKVSHDVPLWGGGWARVKSVATDENGDVISATLDDVVAMEAGKTYAVRFRLAGGDSTVASVLTQSGETNSIAIIQPIPAVKAPAKGDLAMFGEAERESVDLLVKAIRHAGDFRATLILVDAAPEVHDADTGPIPAFDPQITVPLPVEYERPAKPVIQAVDSGTEALSIGADGQVQSRVLITLAPQTTGLVPAEHIQTQYRRADTDAAWCVASPAPADARVVAIGPVDDGVVYDIRLRSVSAMGRTSDWAATSHVVIGKTEPPSDVTGFVINVLGDTAHLSWDAVPDLDLAHYRIKFAPVLVGASWSASVDLVAKVARPATSVAVPTMTGTYLIKAVDLGGRESEHATLIVTAATAVLGRNVVETIAEHPAFAGTLENCVVANDRLRLAGADALADWPQLSDIDAIGFGLAGIATEGIYTFAGALDLGAVYTSRLTAVLKVTGENVANIVKAWTELKAVERLSGADSGQYGVRLEVRNTGDDPAAAPVWTAWQPFTVGEYTARAFQWRAQCHPRRSWLPPLCPNRRPAPVPSGQPSL